MGKRGYAERGADEKSEGYGENTQRGIEAR
jgi:hypothetical protein